MPEKILLIYKSSTGFTKQYAQWISEEIPCTVLPLKEARTALRTGVDTVLFGGRLHAGTVDGLKAARKLFQKSGAGKFIVFATGASPQEAQDTITEMWKKNLSPEELGAVPHFYFPSGLRYETMAFLDRKMMQLFQSMMEKRADKTEAEQQFADAISQSYDISSKEYIQPLVQLLRENS